MEYENGQGIWEWKIVINGVGKRVVHAVCSACNHRNGRKMSRYCPNCGAKMQKSDTEYFEICRRMGMPANEKSAADR